MFERLNDSFNGLFKKISGKSEITESNVREAMEEVETALLEADVHYDVVRGFCDEVLDEALGEKVIGAVEPGEQMIAIVHRKLIEILGGDPEAPPEAALDTSAYEVPAFKPGPTVVMMCGLQGSGKTTTCGKLAARLRKQGRSVMVAAADLQRPAAVEQLETVTEQVRENAPGETDIAFYAEKDKVGAYGERVGVAVEVCRNALKSARDQGIDTLILDTAGRLHVDNDLMGELAGVQRAVEPHQIYLVVDAMTGQDAVNSAKAFHEQLAVDGVILTKFDSDTRGGAAISVRKVTGAPIRFMGVGEHLDRLEPFHPQRIAGRILGMGDVVSLVEKAQAEVSEAEAERLQNKMARGELGMDDFLKQLKTIRRMGPMKQILGMLPGVGSALKDIPIDDGQLDSVEAMINSMTKEERAKPDVINNPRKRRIANGSGSKQEEVGRLVNQFGAINKMTKMMGGMGGADQAERMAGLAAGAHAGIGGMGLPGMGGKGSTKSASSGRFKSRKGGGKGKKRRR
ncbi:MAG: signal recognition particle protein [Planctomycetota bacterium]